MTPAALPALDLGQLQQLLRRAGEHEDAGRFAAETLGLLATSGVASSVHLRSLAAGEMPRPVQALADCAHFLAIMHVQVPSLFELASSHEEMATAGWLREAAGIFDEDRRWLARLSVLTGADIDLQGLTMAEQVVRDQREAMLTLAKSSRAGCALGAAVTMALDWQVLRTELPKAAHFLGFECRNLQAADWPVAGAGTALAEAGRDERSRRAVAFGAAQLATLHGQLFHLLEARHSVRLS